MGTGDPSDLPSDKKRRVLDAATREFANRGFENASTNNIVKEAGISKGLLFHYFGNKRALYLEVLDDCNARLLEFFRHNWKGGSPDPLERFFEWSALKIRMYRDLPDVYLLGVQMMAGIPDDLKPAMDERIASLARDLMPLYLDGVDMSALRSDVSQNEALDLITIVANSLVERYLRVMTNAPDKGLSQVDSLMAKGRRYLGLLRDGLYRRPADR